MTIICEPDAHRAADLASVMDGDVRIVDSVDGVRDLLAGDAQEAVVVLGPDTALDEVMPLATQLKAERPQLSILLLRDAIVPEEVAASVAAGVRRVLPSADQRPLVEALRTATAEAAILVADAPPASADESLTVHKRGQVITVFSPKGGSGKTTISTNLAVALHDSGTDCRVCLVDLDLEFGDVAISMRLEPVKSLVDAVTTEAPENDDDALAMLTTQFRPGLDCILAPIEPGEASKISGQLVTDLLFLLRSRYDYVVVDTPSQLSENVLAALDSSDDLVLLTNPEIPALKNLRLTLDMLDLLGYRREARLILFNKADDASGLTAAEVEEALGASLVAHIPASRDVPASINKGVPIVAAKPDHAVSVAIRNFARQFIVKAPADAARSGKRSRLFRRRSS